MPDYHALQALCDDVARELEAAERDDTYSGEKAKLTAAESAVIDLFRGIVRAIKEFD